MNTLVICVGLPRSGKTSWSKQQGHPIVNPDSIRLALHGKPFIGLAEPFVWAIARVMVRALFLAGHDTVIVDACNTTRKRRDDWHSQDWSCKFKVFNTDVAECLCRASDTAVDEDHLQGLANAIERMHEQFEPLEIDEGRL